MESRFSLSEENLVHLVAFLTAGMGVINMLSAVRPALRYRMVLLEQFLPFGIATGGRLTSAVAGFALLLLSVSLWRRKQLGWVLTVAILVVSIVTHLLKGLDYEEATLAALLAGLLVYLRPHFHARSDVPSVRQGLQILAAALLFTLAYGVIGFYLLDKHFRVSFGLWAAFRQTIVMFTQFYSPGLEPLTGYGRYFADSIYVVGAVTIGYAFLMLLRPVLNRRTATEAERARAWEIVRAYGNTSLARLTLLDDKHFFFSVNGSLISYVVENRVALTLGGPIGPVEDLSAAVEAFKSYCAQNDWQVAFFLVMSSQLDIYKAAGFEALAVGQDALVDLSEFTLAGSENKTLRNSFNKMVRFGYHADVVQPPFSPRMLRELASISDEWLFSRGLSELRFSLGWFDEIYLNTCPILLVRDREGFIEGFANILTEFQSDEVSLDLMRHRQHTESGLMDFLFVSLFQWARSQNYATFNLGLSALAGVGERSNDPAFERTLNFIYRNVNRFYNFRGLHTFKDKFHPDWVPRYLIYPGAASLPAVSIALLSANLGGSLFSNLVRRT